MGAVQTTNRRPTQRYVAKKATEERISEESEGDVVDFLCQKVKGDLDEARRRKAGKGKGQPRTPQLYFVRGPMGSGCSSLCDELAKRLGRGRKTIIGSAHGAGASQNGMYAVSYTHLTLPTKA